MNQDHDKERIKDDELRLNKERSGMSETHEDWFVNGFPDEGALDVEDDWLDTSKACNLNDPECDACQ